MGQAMHEAIRVLLRTSVEIEVYVVAHFVHRMSGYSTVHSLTRPVQSI